MNETSGRGGAVLLQVGLFLGLGFCGVLIYAIYQVGSETLRTMGYILVGALALAIVLVASALPIRAWRRKDFTGDHFHTDGTRTIVKETKVIDGRQPAQADIKVLQMPQASQAAAFPELLQAAFRAGRNGMGAGQPTLPPPNGYHEAELPEVDFDDPEGWAGDIRG